MRRRGRCWAGLGLLVATLTAVPVAAFPPRAAAAASVRGVIFVHGIHVDARFPGFAALLQPLLEAYPNSFESFTYFDDLANRDEATGQCAARLVPAYPPVAGFPVHAPSPGTPAYCDSEDDVGLNAVMLDQDITRRAADWQTNRITLIANSMGGAIVRAYLAYATQAGSPSLASVDSILFLQGAQEGSWLAKADQVANSLPASAIPDVHSAVSSLEQLAFDEFQIDASRPAMADLTPQSDMYLFDSQPQDVPAIRYANVASDITTQVATQVWWWTVTADLPVRLGDYVMVPGFDDRTRTDWMGGARFLPSAIGLGASSTQWVLPGQATIQRRTAADGTSYWDLSQVLNAPTSHFQLGTQLAQIVVDGSSGQTTLDRALLDWMSLVDSSRLPSSSAAAARTSAPRVGAGSPLPAAPSPAIPATSAAPPLPPGAAQPNATAPVLPVPLHTRTFVDQQSGLALILPEPAARGPQPGTFAFQVPGRGVYTGPIDVSRQPSGSGTLAIAYNGPASLTPLATSLSASPPVSHPTSVAVQLSAVVDFVHGTADATLVDGSARFHLVSRPLPGAREMALAAFESASLRQDWHALYAGLSQAIRGGLSEARFADQSRQAAARAGRLRNLRRIGLEDVRLGQDGVVTFRATYEVTRETPTGVTATERYVATFLQQGSDWRLWFMEKAP